VVEDVIVRSGSGVTPLEYRRERGLQMEEEEEEEENVD